MGTEFNQKCVFTKPDSLLNIEDIAFEQKYIHFLIVQAPWPINHTNKKRNLQKKKKRPMQLTCSGTFENVSSLLFPGTEQKAFQVKAQTGPNKPL